MRHTDEIRAVNRQGGRQRWRDSLLWLVVVLLALLWVSDLVRVWRMTNHHDLDVFYLAARRLVAGEDIYADAAPFQASIEAGTFSMKDDTVVWPYAYSPLIALLFVPATAMPYSVVQILWWGFNVGSLLLGGWLSLRALGCATPARVALSLLLLYKFEPAVVTLRLGQIEIVQFLLLAFTLYALNHNWDRRAGLALGLAAGLKFFPGALVGLLLWRGRWRAAAWSTATAFVIIMGSFLLVGFDALSSYLGFASMYGIGGAFAAFPFNQSLNGFFSRNLIHNVFSPTLKGWHLPGLAKGLTLACDTVVILVSAWLTWHRKEERNNEDRQRFALEFSLGIVALLLVLPHSQVYTFVWLLVSFIAFAIWLLSQPRTAWWQWAGWFIAALLVGRHYVLFYPGLTRLVQAHYLFGALLLWGMLGATLLRDKRRTVAL